MTHRLVVMALNHQSDRFVHFWNGQKKNAIQVCKTISDNGRLKQNKTWEGNRKLRCHGCLTVSHWLLKFRQQSITHE